MLWVASFAATLWLLWAAWVVFGPELVSRLIARAKRTPYYHLDGYMNRWWLVPYRDEVLRRPWGQDFESTDGTGPVRFRKRPIAWLLQRFNVSVRVHEILRSDHDRHPHDHPFSYLTIILRGTYWERRFDSHGRCISNTMRGPGSIMWRRKGSWHLLELYQGTVTTLFFTGRKEDGVWGFNVDGQKMLRREYEKTHRRPWA